MLDVARMDVFVPGGSSLPIGWIEFCGPGHPKAVKLSNEAQRRNLDDARDRLIKGNRYKPPHRTPEQVNEETARWVCDRITAWSFRSRVKGEDGSVRIQETPFTHDLAMRLLGDPKKAWLLNAAAEFLVAVENFMPASSQN